MFLKKKNIKGEKRSEKDIRILLKKKKKKYVIRIFLKKKAKAS